MENWVKGALLDFEDVLRGVFDDVGNGVAVGGAEHEGAEDEHVEGTEQQFLLLI
jgi:hypothetical protein